MNPDATAADLERLDQEGTPGAVAELGSAWDAGVEAVVREIAAAPVDERAQLRAALGRPGAEALRSWGERMASLAVRRDEAELLVLGLVALSLADDRLVDERERLLAVPLHRRAAKLLGEKPKRLFDDAAARSDAAGARWLGEQRASRMKPRHMGFEESVDADGGFRFVQKPPPGMDRAQLERFLQVDD